MNKSELVDAIAESTQLTKVQSLRVLDATLETITNELAKGGDITLVGFGTFSVKHRAARSGRNPSTNKPIAIAAANVPGFKPGANLKKAVN
ncbi:HU family DNA-binding protein [Pseudomonas sp.]|uniref:HU family DNA-binding protein n=1 Tax=Pseudomonas sp. TaxID=306 RepID=UPI00290A40B6|nr:HU family DNA-binding protein [Pseudomonas sp.]MDU4254544.1 HU family DNA-binding protein [Pseudomonas sp.]